MKHFKMHHLNSGVNTLLLEVVEKVNVEQGRKGVGFTENPRAHLVARSTVRSNSRRADSRDC